MAIEPVKIQSNPISLKPENKNIGGFSNDKPSILEQANSDAKNSIEEARERDKERADKERDRIALSDEARAVLQNNIANNNFNFGKQEDVELTSQALEFRGLKLVSQNRDLTEKEQVRAIEIKNNFSERGINTEEEILDIADEALTSFQQETPDLVNQLITGNISGQQFGRLNQINQLLNKSNGFGSEEIEGSLNTRVSQLTSQFNDALEQAANQKLSRDQVANLEKLQEEISTIQGFRLNVRDSIGPDGVVV